MVINMTGTSKSDSSWKYLDLKVSTHLNKDFLRSLELCLIFLSCQKQGAGHLHRAEQQHRWVLNKVTNLEVQVSIKVIYIKTGGEDIYRYIIIIFLPFLNATGKEYSEVILEAD